MIPRVVERGKAEIWGRRNAGVLMRTFARGEGAGIAAEIELPWAKMVAAGAATRRRRGGGRRVARRWIRIQRCGE